MAVKTYRAEMRFEVLEFQADSEEEADEKIHEMLDLLGAHDVKLNWENVWWDLYELV